MLINIFIVFFRVRTRKQKSFLRFVNTNKIISSFLKLKVIKKGSGNIRIKDIALKAGVSIGTVDRVIHNRGEVSKSTRDNILQIIKEFDYKPNILASTLASKKTVVFASLLPKALSTESYWNRPLKGISKSISELQQYGVALNQYFFNMENASTFTYEANKILKEEPDGVLLAPWAHREASIFVKKLDEKGIPYVFIDSNMADANPVSYIGQNSFQSGYLSAKLLDFGLLDNSLILIVHIAKELDNQNHLLQREKGFFSYFNERGGDIKRIVKIELEKGEDEIGAKLKETGISTNDIDGVFVTNSKVHIAAGYFSSRKDVPKIIGYDLIPDNIKLLKSGAIDFLICQKPEKQGYNAINALFDHVVQKKYVNPENYTSIDIIAKENLDYYSSI